MSESLFPNQNRFGVFPWDQPWDDNRTLLIMRFLLVPHAVNLAAKMEQQTEELEKQHSQFKRHFQNMDLSAGKQKKMVTKLEDHCERMVRRNVKLEARAVTVGHNAKESKKQKSELSKLQSLN